MHRLPMPQVVTYEFVQTIWARADIMAGRANRMRNYGDPRADAWFYASGRLDQCAEELEDLYRCAECGEWSGHHEDCYVLAQSRRASLTREEITITPFAPEDDMPADSGIVCARGLTLGTYWAQGTEYLGSVVTDRLPDGRQLHAVTMHPREDYRTPEDVITAILASCVL